VHGPRRSALSARPRRPGAAARCAGSSCGCGRLRQPGAGVLSGRGGGGARTWERSTDSCWRSPRCCQGRARAPRRGGWARQAGRRCRLDWRSDRGGALPLRSTAARAGGAAPDVLVIAGGLVGAGHAGAGLQAAAAHQVCAARADLRVAGVAGARGEAVLAAREERSVCCNVARASRAARQVNARRAGGCQRGGRPRPGPSAGPRGAAGAHCSLECARSDNTWHLRSQVPAWRSGGGARGTGVERTGHEIAG
jgi:hypothetical protein